MKIHNFCAGPSILPNEVFNQASKAVKDLDESGLSLLEISHRSHAFVNIMDEARDLALELLNLSGSNYTSLFLQGGASSQFLMTAYNFLKNEAAFLNTGTWSKKAIKEAKLFGKVDVLGSSEDKNFNHIPDLVSFLALSAIEKLIFLVNDPNLVKQTAIFIVEAYEYRLTLI